MSFIRDTMINNNKVAKLLSNKLNILIGGNKYNNVVADTGSIDFFLEVTATFISNMQVTNPNISVIYPTVVL